MVKAASEANNLVLAVNTMATYSIANARSYDSEIGFSFSKPSQ
jgi:hypothetical protein